MGLPGGPRRTLVIGYGNTLRGDDGVGPRVAEAVARRGRPTVEALAVHQLTPELAARIADAELVIFVDARLAVAPSESCHVHEIGPDAPGPADGHVCEPRSLLALARSLFGASPEALAVTIPAIDLTFGERLSPTALREMETALRAIDGLLAPGDDGSERPVRAEEAACTS